MNAEQKIALIVLRLHIISSDQPARQKRALENIRRFVLTPCGATHQVGEEYQLRIPYYTDEGLNKIMQEILEDIDQEAYIERCVSETEARLLDGSRYW